MQGGDGPILYTGSNALDQGDPRGMGRGYGVDPARNLVEGTKIVKVFIGERVDRADL